MSAQTPLTPETSLSRLMLVGCLGAVMLGGVLGGWATTTRISGAVTAIGQIDVAGKPKTVQTLDGGILAELSVRNGDTVRAGQVLARLDPTLLQINLDMARSRLAGAIAQRNRLEAERGGAERLTFNRSDQPETDFEVWLDTTKARSIERAIFSARAEMRRGERDRIASHLADVISQVEGTEGQIGALVEQISYLDQDLGSLDLLVSKGLARNHQLSEVRRVRAIVRGDLFGRRAELARLDNRRRELALEALQDERVFQQQVATDLRDTTAEIEDLTLSILTRQAQLDRVELRAPTDGVVHEVQMTTVGGVIAPGGKLMDIIPQNSGFEFEVHVAPRDIHRVRQNQPTKVVLSAFDQRTTPRLSALVETISPEPIKDRQTGEMFYRVLLEVPHAELSRLPNEAQLIPGMPLEAFLQTQEKTVLSYLTEPLRANLYRGFRE